MVGTPTGGSGGAAGVSGPASPSGTGPAPPPDLDPAPPTGPDRIVAAFAHALRANGLAVPTDSMILFTRALAAVGLGSQEAVYWAGRSTLVHRREDAVVYDRVFRAFWLDRIERPLVEERPGQTLTLATDDGPDDADGDDGGDGEDPGEMITVRYSAAEILRDKDLAALTAPEWVEAQGLISQLRVCADMRPSRRTRPARRRHGGAPPDLRRTLRGTVAHGGEPIRRSWRAPVERPRRLVFVLDVSGSMEPYARALVRFAHAAVASRGSGRVEVFTIGTRLTRISRELDRRDPDAALASSARAVADWSGGTRLGESLQEFNDRWGVRGLARGAVVVVFSDGWDRGAPELVASEMARLHRVARRVVWVNPLKASPGYEPLARGMAAALPYVDQFVEGHSVASLDELARVVVCGGPKEVRRRAPLGRTGGEVKNEVER